MSRSRIFDRIKPKTVRSGKRIRGQWKLLEMAERRPGQWQQTVEITIEIEGEDKPALICEWMTLFFV